MMVRDSQRPHAVKRQALLRSASVVNGPMLVIFEMPGAFYERAGTVRFQARMKKALHRPTAQGFILCV